MATSWLQRLSGTKAPHPRNRHRRDGAPPPIESLERRVMLTVTASLAAGTLNVVGDDQDNAIVVSRTTGGTILVNNGAVPIQGGPATLANTNHFQISGAGGNDNVSLNEANGPLPGASIFGGAGNDTLTGGSGDDFIDGEAGNDTIFLGAGDDDFSWNPGDGSDIVDGGGGGKDSAVVNGSDLPDTFDLSAHGSALQIIPSTGDGATSLSSIENVIVNPLGGADTVVLHDLTGAAPNILQINLAATLDGSVGDRQPDTVILNATNSADVIPISGAFNFANSGVINVNDGSVIGGTLPYSLDINATEGDLDTLDVNALAGNDTVDASGILATNAAQPIRLAITGGPGNDTLTGSAGADTFVWNAGDGSDSIDGADGPDSLVVNGSDLSEKFTLSANGALARFTRDLDGAESDLANVEEIDLNPLGGADTITVNDLTGTAVSGINLNLAGANGTTPDTQLDSVIINGTNAADSIPIVGRSGIVVVDRTSNGFGLPYFTAIRALDPTDSLRVNGNGGSDTVNVDLNFPLNLSIDGGIEHDTINVTATAPNSAPAILPSTGDDDVNVATGQGNFAAVRFNATQRIGALTVGNNGLATITANGATVLTSTSLGIAPGGKLDVSNNSEIVDYAPGAPTPFATIRSLLHTGFNAGAWNGSGILTSLGSASRFGLGFAEASDVAPGGTFAGQPVDTTAVVLRFTLNGDANLNGVVDIFDLNALLPHFNKSGDWTAGDSNYSGNVDIFDLNALLPNFNTALPAHSALTSAAGLTDNADSVSGPTSQIPSPTTPAGQPDTSVQSDSAKHRRHQRRRPS